MQSHKHIFQQLNDRNARNRVAKCFVHTLFAMQLEWILCVEIWNWHTPFAFSSLHRSGHIAFFKIECFYYKKNIPLIFCGWYGELCFEHLQLVRKSNLKFNWFFCLKQIEAASSPEFALKQKQWQVNWNCFLLEHWI